MYTNKFTLLHINLCTKKFGLHSRKFKKKGEKVEKVKQCLRNRELLANNGAGYSSPRLTIIHDRIFF